VDRIEDVEKSPLQRLLTLKDHPCLTSRQKTQRHGDAKVSVPSRPWSFVGGHVLVCLIQDGFRWDTGIPGYLSIPINTYQWFLNGENDYKSWYVGGVLVYCVPRS